MLVAIDSKPFKWKEAHIKRPNVAHSRLVITLPATLHITHMLGMPNMSALPFFHKRSLLEEFLYLLLSYVHTLERYTTKTIIQLT